MAKRGQQRYSRFELAFTSEAREWARFAAGAQKARKFAITKLARSLPVAWRRDIKETVNLPVAEIRERIDVQVQGDSVLLIGRKRPIGLVNFGGRWLGLKRTGAKRRKSPSASAQMYRNAARKTYDSAFIASGRAGNTQIFKRTGDKRLPIRALYGPSMPAFFRNADRQARLYKVAAEIYEKELKRVGKFA